MWAWLHPFLMGAAHIMDLGGTLGPRPHVSDNPQQDDADALRSDWEAVGGDLRRAIAQTEAERRELRP